MNPVQFCKEAYQELRKVAWMPRQQLIGSTVVVIVLVCLVAVYAGFIDMVLSRLLRILLGGA